MAKIIDRVEMANPVQSSTTPQPQVKAPSILNARKAVCDFLKGMPDVREVNVTKLAVMDSERGIWEAEADVYTPNPTIKALGLPVVKQVLDCDTYILRLNNQLEVVAYGLKDSLDLASR